MPGPPNLVYAASGHEVKTAMVAGKVLIRDRQMLTADENAVRAEAQMQEEAVARRVATDPAHKDMALLEATQAGLLKRDKFFGYKRQTAGYPSRTDPFIR